MKIVDAVWEKRNLNCKVYEVEIDVSDTLLDSLEVINSLECDYISLKIPTQRYDFTNLMQENNFRFIEDMITVRHDLREVSKNRIMQRLYDTVSYHLMSEDEYIILQEEIMRGMFVNDRISNDPFFSVEQVNQRYVGWVNDLKNDSHLFYQMTYKGIPSGFVILKKQENSTYYSVLGAAYEKYRNTGLGTVQKEQEIVRSLGGKSVYTNVSSNNPTQLKALVQNGYVPEKIDHVFIKHLK